MAGVAQDGNGQHWRRLATNAGRVNVPDTTEETLSLVLAQTADSEDKKGCGAVLAELPGT